jgi:hypothetical protein
MIHQRGADKEDTMEYPLRHDVAEFRRMRFAPSSSALGRLEADCARRS